MKSITSIVFRNKKMSYMPATKVRKMKIKATPKPIVTRKIKRKKKRRRRIMNTIEYSIGTSHPICKK